MNNNKMSVKDLALQAMIAAVYVAITFGFYPLSFKSPQIRISEFMLILVFFNRKHVIGLLLGCAIANFFGPMSVVDMVFGTMASAMVMLAMIKTPNRLLAFVWPSVINAVFIGLQLYFMYQVPLVLGMSEVFIGEFAATFIPALFLLKPLMANETMQRLFA